MAQTCDISVVVSTYNRCDLLPRALESILVQDDCDASYEVIVVDNNSEDETGAVMQKMVARSGRNLRYLLEPRQGVSYARNTGIAHARGPIIAFFDDDVCVARNWISTIKQSFDRHSDVDCVGGRVLPEWPCDPPSWLTRDHWAPVALQDYGDREFYIDLDNRLCLLSANLAVRSSVFDRIGRFAPELQRVKNGIGSMEDLELLTRLWRAHGRAMYVPTMVATAQVPTERLTRQYHRRWHEGNGRFYAMFRSDEMEQSNAGRIFDVPAHLYRQAISDALHWTKEQALGNRDQAFVCETRMRFFAGFFRRRRADFLANRGTQPRRSFRSSDATSDSRHKKYLDV
jgi:glucosyl-dolichyl phosphate glucuronosyltransferase